VVENDTDAEILVTVTNTGSTVEQIVAAYSSSFIGIQGRRPDVFNAPASGGNSVAYGDTVQTLTGPPGAVTVTVSAGSASLQADGSILVTSS
jgi:hypothetical protein